MAGSLCTAPQVAQLNAMSPFDAPLFEARLIPYRSLGRRGICIAIMSISGGACIASLPFAYLGAWPVVAWLALNLCFLCLAFRANMRAARAYEDVTLTSIELSIAKVSARGARREWRFNPLWVRLERVEDEEFGVSELSLASRGRRLPIASFLGPQAKAAFARDFAAALARARQGPRFS